jgi:plastocyanin
MTRALRTFALATVVLLAFAACGGGEKVGEAFKGFKGDKGGQRIGDVQQTPTPKPAVSGVPAAKTPVPVQKQPPPQQSIALQVKITASGFDPTAARVIQGSNVKVTNTDNLAHTYTSHDATYDSGSLAPGQSVTFAASTPGSFQMEDRTRNWIIGSLEVVRR